MNKFIESLAKLLNKATSCHKKNNAIVLDNTNSREHLPQFGSWDLKKRCILSPNMEREREQAARIKEMEDEQRNFSWMMDCPYPTIPPETQMPLEQSSGQKQDLERPSVDPFRVPFRRPLWAREIKWGFVPTTKWHQVTTKAWFTWAKTESCWKPEYT